MHTKKGQTATDWRDGQEVELWLETIHLEEDLSWAPHMTQKLSGNAPIIFSSLPTAEIPSGEVGATGSSTLITGVSTSLFDAVCVIDISGVNLRWQSVQNLPLAPPSANLPPAPPSASGQGSRCPGGEVQPEPVRACAGG